MPDETEHRQTDSEKPGLMRQHLLAALGEPGEGGLPAGRLIVSSLINTALGGDLASIKEIFERADGKSPPAAAAADDGNRKVTFEWKPSTTPSSTTHRDPISIPSTNAANASP